jgi:hypothetical protein
VPFDRFQTEAAGRVSLRIEIDQKHADARAARQAARLTEVVVLPTPAFLIRHSDDFHAGRGV